MRRGKWILGGIALVLVGLVIWLWPVLRAVIKVGLPQGPELRKYEGTSQDNLKAIRTALLFYHDNEDRFPEGSGWMNAIEGQLRTNDLTPEEALKKLHNPTLPNAGPNDYGYALNQAVAGKHRQDVGGDSTVLVFETDRREKNAVGDPKEGKGKAITLKGDIVKAP